MLPRTYLIVAFIATLAFVVLSNEAEAFNPPPLNYSNLQTLDLIKYTEGQSTWAFRSGTGCGNVTTDTIPDQQKLFVTSGTVSNVGVGSGSYHLVKTDALPINAGSCPGDRFTNLVIFNLTFFAPFNLTSVMYQCTSGSQDFEPDYLWLLNSTLTVVGNLSLAGATSCPSQGGGGNHLDFWLNGTFNNVTYLQLIKNTGSGTLTGSFALDALYAYSTSYPQNDYPMEWALLEYAAQGGAALKLSAGATTPDDTLESDTVSFPPGTGFYYASMIAANPCQEITSLPDASESDHCWLLVSPVSTSTDLTIDYLGSSYAWGSGVGIKRWSLWYWSNVATSSRSAVLEYSGNGIAQANGCTEASQALACKYIGNWTGSEGAMFSQCNTNNCTWTTSGSGTIPFARAKNWCAADGSGCFLGGSNNLFNATYGFGYKSTQGPFFPVPVFNMFEFAGVTQTDFNYLLTESASEANFNPFTTSLDSAQGDYVGNAVFLVLLRDTDDPLPCTQDIQVNGIAVDVLTSFNSNNADVGHIEGCIWLIDDYGRSLGQTRLSTGMYPNYDNQMLGRTYEIFLPETLSQFTDWRTISGFKGLRSLRFICNGNAPLCYGNIDTGALAVGGSRANTQYNIETYDRTNESNQRPLTGVLALETVGSQANTTTQLNPPNGPARAIINSTEENPRFYFSPPAGYRPAYLNFTSITQTVINITIFFDARSNRTTQNTDCQAINGTYAECVITFLDPTQSDNPSCDSNPNAQGCDPGSSVPPKRYAFFCPVDGVSNAPMTQSSVSESISGYAKTFATCRNDGQPDEVTTNITGTTISLGFSKLGYRGLNANITGLTRQFINVLSFMKTGTGTATSVEITYSNSTGSYAGQVVTITTLVIRDTGAAAASPTGGVPGIGSGFQTIASAFGAIDAGGRLLFMIAIIIGVTLLLYKYANGFVVVGIDILLFFVFAYFGFVESWLLIVVVLVMLALGVFGILSLTRRTSE